MCTAIPLGKTSFAFDIRVWNKERLQFFGEFHAPVLSTPFGSKNAQIWPEDQHENEPQNIATGEGKKAPELKPSTGTSSSKMSWSKMVAVAIGQGKTSGQQELGLLPGLLFPGLLVPELLNETGFVFEIWLLMQAIVIRVERDEKEEGTCEVALMPQVPSNWLGLTSRMGAGNRLSSIYSPEPLAFETVIFRFKALKGGRSRTKIPRPERRTASE